MTTTAEGTPTPAAPDRFLAGLFWVAALLPVALLVWLPYFVTVDGPTHLGGGAAVIRAIAGDGGMADRFATLHLLPLTNLIPELPLGVLIGLIGPQWAEKVVLLGYLVGFPLAAVWAVRGVAPERWWLGFVAIPLTFSFALNWGFYNFCYGMIGFVIGAGYVARHRGRWTPGSAVTLAVIATLTYVAHVLPFVQLVVLIGIAGLFDMALSPRGWAAGLRGAIPMGLALIPGLALTLLLVADRPPAVGPSSFSPIVSLAATVGLAWGMITFDVKEAIFTSLVALSVAVLALFALRDRIRVRHLEPGDAYLVFAVLALIEVGLVPSGVTLGSGGSFVAQRLGFVPVLGVLLWIAGRTLPTWTPRLLAGATVVAAVGILGVRLPAYAALGDEVVSLVATAPCVATDATVLQVNLGRVVPGSLDRSDSLSDEAGRLTTLTHGWPIANVEFEVGFFPLRNRAETSVYATLIPAAVQTTPVWEPIQGIPPTIDLEAYEQTVGSPIDYVLVFGRSLAEPATLTDPDWLALEAQLGRGYALVTTSSNGHLEVFERTGSAAAERGATRRTAAGTC